MMTAKGWGGSSGMGTTPASQGRVDHAEAGGEQSNRWSRSHLVGVATSDEHVAKQGAEVHGFLITKV